MRVTVELPPLRLFQDTTFPENGRESPPYDLMNLPPDRFAEIKARYV